jgi:antitoxin VapB
VYLNIKSPEADALVAELTRLTGESKTGAVIVALRERLERAHRERERQRLSSDLLAIGKRCATRGRHATTDHGELLYDEAGLPR